MHIVIEMIIAGAALYFVVQHRLALRAEKARQAEIQEAHYKLHGGSYTLGQPAEPKPDQPKPSPPADYHRYDENGNRIKSRRA